MELFADLFYRISAVLLLSAVLGAVATLLRQPLIIAFLAAGIVSGPAVLGWVEPTDELELLATLGISVLLFVVGLRLDLSIIRTMGPVALLTGLGQVGFTSIFGFLIALGFGMSVVGAVYVAVALTFSSTIIIVKLLSDKRELDALHGRIAVGFLIVQDIVVIIAMIVLSAFDGPNGEAQTSIALDLLGVAFKGLLMLAGLALLAIYVLPRLMRLLARSPELLVLFAVAWAVSLASLGDVLGFSKEVGAFLAGVSLASTPFRESIGSRLVSLRDFLLLFFFISLGATLELDRMAEQIVPAVVFSVFVLIGNPLIVMIIMGVMGYRKRTGFLAGLTVAQISEFSLILTALGVSLGHIDRDTLGLVTLVGVITIGLSTYMILYSHKIYDRIAPLLTIFERKMPSREMGEDDSAPARPDVILFGLGRFGRRIGDGLTEQGLRVFGVDFDPYALSKWKALDRPGQYGDATDPELLASLPINSAACVVCAAPGRESNLALLTSLRDAGYRGRVVTTANSPAQADEQEEAGATLVLRPFDDAAEAAAHKIAELTDDGE